MRKILALCLALLLVFPALALATEENGEEVQDELSEKQIEEALTEEEILAISAVEMPVPADWRKTVEADMAAASFTEETPFDTEGIGVDEASQYRYESKWDAGQIILWQEVYSATDWAGYGLIFATRYETDAELATIAQRCREATLIALGDTHPKLSTDKIETFLNALCPDYAEVAKSPTYTERSAPLGSMMYTVSGGGTWGFPTIQAFHNANTDAYLRELQGTK